MIGTHILKGKTTNNTSAIIAGTAVLAGLALVYAIPKTRNACQKLFKKALDFAKDKVSDAGWSTNNQAKDWEADLANAEKLKGPMDKRKTPAIKVSSAGTSAWKEDWSSE